MTVTGNLLFCGAELSNVLRNQLVNVTKEVDSISKEQFFANSNEQIADNIYSRMIIAPLEISRDHMSLTEPREVRTERQNHFGEIFRILVIRTELTIPYTGESDLWVIQPSTITFNPPRGDYSPQHGNDQAGVLRFQMEFTQDKFSDEAINLDIESNLKSIDDYLGWIKRDIELHNPQLQSEIIRQVAQRKERIATIQSVAKTLSIPIYPRDGAPSLLAVPLQRKIIHPLSTKGKLPPEYTITNEDYENILKVIRHEGCTYERSPETFAKFDEEELRNILLAHLNGHYLGQANGEVFRKKGKTDICIEFENRAAFVAECKLWKGDQNLNDAVGQLLSYLTWRDCKASLIVFNKNVAGFRQIQARVSEILQLNPNFSKEEKTQNHGEWQSVFRSSEDSERLVTIHVFLFNLYVANKS